MTLFNVFSLLGGLALFLFGMDIMGKALEKQAGGHLQKILSKLTDNPLKGFFLGLCVTAIIQSSSATTVMVVGFVNSGIMELHQAIGIIMGSNVGTTVAEPFRPAGRQPLDPDAQAHLLQPHSRLHRHPALYGQE